MFEINIKDTALIFEGGGMRASYSAGLLYRLHNETLEELKELECEGKAFHVHPDVETVSNMEKDYQKLKESYRLGYEHGKRDVCIWKDFLGS